jgi:hypothetical protein
MPLLIVGSAVVAAAVLMVPVLFMAAALGGAGGTAPAAGGGSLSGDCDFDQILSDAAAGKAEGTAYVSGHTEKVPQKFIPIYSTVSEKKKLGGCGPSILAGIHSIESGFADTGYSTVNSSGAGGPWQFLQSSWEAFVVGCNEPGSKSWPAYSVENGACAAANHLISGGAPKNWRDGIYSYNHADWYVYAITLQAKRFAGDVGGGT